MRTYGLVVGVLGPFTRDADWSPATVKFFYSLCGSLKMVKIFLHIAEKKKTSF